MKVQVKISFRVSGYENMHSGYCSGEECTFTEINSVEQVSILMEAAAFYDFISKCDGLPLIEDHIARELLKEELKEYNIDCGEDGSMYCRNDPRAEARGIDPHDAKIEFSEFTLVKFKSIKI